MNLGKGHSCNNSGVQGSREGVNVKIGTENSLGPRTPGGDAGLDLLQSERVECRAVYVCLSRKSSAFRPG